MFHFRGKTKTAWGHKIFEIRIPGPYHFGDTIMLQSFTFSAHFFPNFLNLTPPWCSYNRTKKMKESRANRPQDKWEKKIHIELELEEWWMTYPMKGGWRSSTKED
jgi:hypothetical protein